MTEESREVAEAVAAVQSCIGDRFDHECVIELVEAVRKDERERVGDAEGEWMTGIAELLVEAGALDDDGPLGRAYLMLDMAMLAAPAEGGTEG